MPRLFGTDGVRGVANKELTPDLALALGRAAGAVLARGGEVIVGRDTRVSGSMLEGALVAGLCSAGAHVRLAGVLPTPAVAFLTLDEKASAGAVISASHNPVPDNGIKFFSNEGFKTSAEVEEQIERLMQAGESDLVTGVEVGSAEVIPDAVDRYVEHVIASVDGSFSTSLKVVLDCAHGAAWAAGPAAFERAGAEVIAINAEADGTRINVGCGSTDLSALAERVVAEGAQLGLAFDGDADRVLAVDERGEYVDGDRLMGLTAVHLHDLGELDNGLLVATVMSNLGFKRALEEKGIDVVFSPVGDKFVAEAMALHGAVLGGEQSGHVILGKHSTTGDGILTGMQIAAIVAGSGRPLSELAHFFEPFPQVLINVVVAAKHKLDSHEPLWEEVRSAEAALGEDGRVLLRASGTEPLVRVMVEASDPAVAQTVAEDLAGSVRAYLN
ncbi:MAG: phosphoglucosamine mutase [Actinomycetota bacterium]